MRERDPSAALTDSFAARQTVPSLVDQNFRREIISRSLILNNASEDVRVNAGLYAVSSIVVGGGGNHSSYSSSSSLVLQNTENNKFLSVNA